MLGKIGWKLITNPDALVCRVFKAKYFPGGDFLTAVIGHSPSFTWRSIYSSQELLRSGLRWKIGSGQAVRVFQDPWIRRDGDFYVRSYHDQSIHDMRASDLMQNGRRCWDEGLVNMLFDEEEAKEILRTPLNSIVMEDKLVWHYSKRGSYSVKTCYEHAKATSLDVSYAVDGSWKKLWKMVVPPKVKFFLWRAAHDVLPTKEKLISKGVAVGEECGICDRDYENTWHVFVSCDFTKECWQNSKYGNTIHSLIERCESFTQLLFLIFNINDMEIKSGISMLMWQLWKDRNDKVWNRRVPISTSSVRMAELALSEWAMMQTAGGGVRNRIGNTLCGGWHDLPQGWSRCGVDAAFFARQNRTGVGIIWQGPRGEFKAAKTITLPGCMRVEEGEAMGVQEALSWIKDKSGECVEVVTDSKLVADALEAKEEDNSEFGDIIENCRRIRDACDRVHIKHVRREANSLAHRLVRKSIEFSTTYVWDEPPYFVDDLLSVPCVCDQ